jgi:hypothetical protein
MKTTLLVVSVALALGTLAACDRNPNPQQRPATSAPTSPSSTAGTGSSATPSTPANAGTPSTAEKKEGSNPVQGQVDPKDPAQNKDFQQKGAGAGPKQ